MDFRQNRPRSLHRAGNAASGTPEGVLPATQPTGLTCTSPVVAISNAPISLVERNGSLPPENAIGVLLAFNTKRSDHSSKILGRQFPLRACLHNGRETIIPVDLARRKSAMVHSRDLHRGVTALHCRPVNSLNRVNDQTLGLFSQQPQAHVLSSFLKAKKPDRR